MSSQEVGWEPLPGSQALALSCECDEILFHGTRGPGKTECQLAAFAKNVGKGYGKHWKGVIFDRGYQNLSDLIAKSLVIFPKIFPGAKWHASTADYRWVFPTGEVLFFRHIRRAQDYRKYHGHEYPYIGFNELTSYPTSELYDSMKSCNRSGFSPLIHSPDLTAEDLRIVEECDLLGEPYPEEVAASILPNIPLVMFSTTNPLGPGHSWVKRKWIDKAAPGVPIRSTRLVFNPRTKQKENITTTIVHIFGSYKENKYLDAKYVAFLDSIKDPNKRRAWLGGDWSITSGGALDDLWNASVHIKPRFVVPKAWRVTRSFDWGSTSPFSVGFWAIANGEEVILPNGERFCPFKGSRIRLAEIYGCEKTKDDLGNMVYAYGTNRGLMLTAAEVARQIKEKQEELLIDGWVQSEFTPGPADGTIFNKDPNIPDKTQDGWGSVGKQMADEGIFWDRADRSAGTRKGGLEMMRVALENAVLGEGPALYVMDNCGAFIETVPSLPRDEDDPEDVDTTAEDHVYDEARYMILEDKAIFTGSINFGFAG